MNARIILHLNYPKFYLHDMLSVIQIKGGEKLK